MSQANGQNNERLERLLRRWGAEEAAHQESAGLVPFCDRLSGTRPSWLRQWLPLAASFIFMVVGAGLYVASLSPSPMHESPPATPAGEAAAPREQIDRALAAQRDAERKLAALEARQAATVSLLEQVHLAAARPGEEGFRTLQTASRENRLLSRGAELRDRISNQAVLRLFDTQEALLTQLDLLDPNKRSDMEAFVKLVRSTDVGPQIDEALRSGGADAAVTQWFIETQLVLSGVKRAG